MLKLTYAPGTIAIAVAIALEEADIPYEQIKVDFASAEQTKPSYLAINPKGRVPALITEGGAVMTETGALLEYIAALKPDVGLIPDAPTDAAHMRAVMFYIASTMHIAHAHKMRGTRWADLPASHADMAAKVPQTMANCADYVVSDCLRGDFVIGDRFSLADAYLFTVCTWLAGDGVALADFPVIDAYLARMEARDSVKTIRAKGML
jgi:glutathione S-transferase